MDNFSFDNSTLSSLLHESQITNQVIWTSDESLLLEQELKKYEDGEDDLRTVLCIAPIFPHKSIQQISLRIKWMKSKRNISWEEYSKNHDTRNNNNNLLNRNMSESYSNENSSNSSISSNLSSPRPPLSDSLSKKSTKTSKSEGYIKSNKRNRTSEFVNTFNANSQGIDLKTIERNTEMILNNINEILMQNDSLLDQIESNLIYHEEFVELNKSHILQFNSNLSLLVDMTDELASPKELPFLSMILNITPDMICIINDYLK